MIKISPIYQSIRMFETEVVSSGAENGCQVEPTLSINSHNYTLFFPDSKEAHLLASQLKKLKSYFEGNF